MLITGQSGPGLFRYDAMETRVTLSAVAATCLWVCGPAVLAVQLLVWLRTGAWPPWTFGDGCSFVGLGRPLITWAEAQQICDWIWSWPLWLGLFVATVILAALVPRPRNS